MNPKRIDQGTSLRLAVIGAGNWGKNLVSNFAALPPVELLYICDLSETVRKAMAGLYPQATVTDQVERVISDPAVDAVVVAVDAPLHYAIARAALQAGKHAYVEKPLTLKSSEA